MTVDAQLRVETEEPALELQLQDGGVRKTDHFMAIPTFGESKISISNAAQGMIGRASTDRNVAGVSIFGYGPHNVPSPAPPALPCAEAHKLLAEIQNAQDGQEVPDPAFLERALLEAVRAADRSTRPATESIKVLTLFIDACATDAALAKAASAASLARSKGYVVRVANVDESLDDGVTDANLAAVADPNALFVGEDAIGRLYAAASRGAAGAPAPVSGPGSEEAGATLISAHVLAYPVAVGQRLALSLDMKLARPVACERVFRVQAVETEYWRGGVASCKDITVPAGGDIVRGELEVMCKFGLSKRDAGLRALGEHLTLELLAMNGAQAPARVGLSCGTVVFPFEIFTGDIYSERYRRKLRESGRRRITILVHGSAGAGKSAFVNAALSCLSAQLERPALTGGTTGHVTGAYMHYERDPLGPGLPLPCSFAEMPGKDGHNFAGEELAMACAGVLASGDPLPKGTEPPLTLRDKNNGARGLRPREGREVELERAAPVVVFVLHAEEARAADSAEGVTARLQQDMAATVRAGLRVAVVVTHGDCIPAWERSRLVERIVRAFAVDANSVHIVANNAANLDKEFEKDKAAYIALLAILDDAFTVPTSTLTRAYGPATAPALAPPAPTPAPAPAPAVSTEALTAALAALLQRAAPAPAAAAQPSA